MDRSSASISLPVEGHLPSFDGATGWLNSGPLTPAGLRGTVVAVDFCTYTCINWLRTLPYVRAWSQRYRNVGLVTIGVHTPEFSVEHDAENVRRALREMRVDYPMALDNDYAVWDAFANRYWPALYLVDADGRIRHHQFGEGDYEVSERVIQQLLAEAGAEHVPEGLVDVEGEGPEAPADWEDLGSPETYLGSEQSQRFSSPERVAPDRPQTYSRPELLAPNHWALAGDWAVGREAAVATEPRARIAFRFSARDVHLVMGPVDAAAPIEFRVLVDRRSPEEANGADVDPDGAGMLDFPRMYQLVRQRGAVDPRLFEIEFFDRGARAFAFTFG
jgi:hypothetical protein